MMFMLILTVILNGQANGDVVAGVMTTPEVCEIAGRALVDEMSKLPDAPQLIYACTPVETGESA